MKILEEREKEGWVKYVRWLRTYNRRLKKYNSYNTQKMVGNGVDFPSFFVQKVEVKINTSDVLNEKYGDYII